MKEEGRYKGRNGGRRRKEATEEEREMKERGKSG